MGDTTFSSKQTNSIKSNVLAPNTIKTVTIPSGISSKDIFDAQYAQAVELMGGDKLLKPAASVNNVIIRKTSTQGLYKLIINNSTKSSFDIKIIDESELLNNRDYCAGTISKVSPNEYEITYFDAEDEITIDRFSKDGVVKYMSEKRMVL